mgnify:CR=1 FL=1
MSVGTTIGTFFVANQPEVIEKTWRYHVDRNKLVNPYNPLLGKKLLDLDYLIHLFNNSIAYLDVDAVIKSKTRLRYALIDYDSGELLWVKPTRENIFRLIMAACSMPIVRGPQKIGDRRFFDAGFVYGGVPELAEIARTHNEVVYVSNYGEQYQTSPAWKFFGDVLFPVAAKFGGYPKPLQEVFKERKKRRIESLNYMMQNKKFLIVAPSEQLFNKTFDTSWKKINEMFDLGKKDAEQFIQRIHSQS